VPFYKGEHIKFDVMPNQLPLTVEHDSVIIAVIGDCSASCHLPHYLHQRDYVFSLICSFIFL